jgi:hypothetical protein
MEPNLTDMDDYNKPLSMVKLRTISLAFAGMLIIYNGLSYLIEALG